MLRGQENAATRPGRGLLPVPNCGPPAGDPAYIGELEILVLFDQHTGSEDRTHAPFAATPYDEDGEIALDSNGSPLQVEPGWWIVCFVPGLRPQWWHRFAHRSHKHVFALRHDDTDQWLLFEPWWTRLMVTNISTDNALAFLRWAARGDALTVKEAVPGNGSQLRGWMSCAALTTYMLGRGYLVWTPHALFRRLSSEKETRALDTRAFVRRVRLQQQRHADRRVISYGYEGLIRHRLSPRASTTRLWLGRVSARVDTA